MSMLHPNYVELMKVVNKGVEEGEEPVISSRYSVVMATAKRARQIVQGAEPLVETQPKEKPLSIAVDELWQDKIQILPNDDADIDDFASVYAKGTITAVSEDDLNENIDADATDDETAEEEADKDEDQDDSDRDESSDRASDDN